MGVTVIEGSRGKALFLTLGSAGFVLVALFMLRDPDVLRDGWLHLVTWMGVVFFGLCGLIGLVRLVRPSRLTLMPEGFSLETPPFGTRRRAWADIDDIFLWGTASTKMVCFTYRPGREPGDPLTAANASLGAPGNLGSHWKIPPEALLELAVAYHLAATPRAAAPD